MMTTANVPGELATYREELQRHLEADVAAASTYADKALALQRSADLLRAQLAGIDRAIAAYQEAVVQRLVPRRAAGED